MRKKSILISLVSAAIIVWFYCGVYVDDEFDETHFFIKPKPTWKWKFTSPRGLSDMSYQDMTSAQQKEQKYWDEYVKKRR